jgi:CBS domain-containing protein
VPPIGGAFDPAPCVGDLAMRKLPVVPEHLPMASARRIAALKGVRLMLVERDGHLVGLLDARALAGAPEHAAVATSMAPISVHLHPATPLERARALFGSAGTTVLPVVVGNLLVGTVTRGDVERRLGLRGGSRTAPSSVAA